MSDIVERLKKYEELGVLSSLPIHPETPGYSTGRLFGDARDAAAEIGRLRTERAWRPIESAPHNEVVLLFQPPDENCPSGMEVGCASWGWTNRVASNISRHGYATHWQPLPPAPGGE